MFRNLFLVIAIGLIIWIIQGFIRRSKMPHKTKISSQNMVQCEQCKTYLPSKDSVSTQGKYFCNTQHLDDWNQQS